MFSVSMLVPIIHQNHLHSNLGAVTPNSCTLRLLQQIFISLTKTHRSHQVCLASAPLIPTAHFFVDLTSPLSLKITCHLLVLKHFYLSSQNLLLLDLSWSILPSFQNLLSLDLRFPVPEPVALVSPRNLEEWQIFMSSADPHSQ